MRGRCAVGLLTSEVCRIGAAAVGPTGDKCRRSHDLDTEVVPVLEAWATDTVVHRELGTDEPFVLGFVRVTGDVVDRAPLVVPALADDAVLWFAPEEVLETVSLGCQPDAGFVTGVASTKAGVSLYLSAYLGRQLPRGVRRWRVRRPTARPPHALLPRRGRSPLPAR
jgi:hypothetical protein